MSGQTRYGTAEDKKKWIKIIKRCKNLEEFGEKMRAAEENIDRRVQMTNFYLLKTPRGKKHLNAFLNEARKMSEVVKRCTNPARLDEELIR